MQRPQNCKRKCERKLCEKQTFSCNGDTLLCGRDQPLPLAKHNLVLSQNFKMNCCFERLSVSALVTHTHPDLDPVNCKTLALVVKVTYKAQLTKVAVMCSELPQS